MLSIVIPCYNEAENIEQTLTDIHQVISFYKYEFIIVDDHSSDLSTSVIERLPYPIRYLRLSRRSGSHTAIRAGLDASRGDAVIFMAADGQDDPQIILQMIEEWKANKQVVWAIRKKRENEHFILMRFATLFYRLLALMIGGQKNNIDLSRADFFLLDRRVVDSLNHCRERNTSIHGLILWMGFKQSGVFYDRKVRRKGSSKWSFSSRWNLAKDWIIAFSAAPLKMMIWLGSFVTVGGAAYAFLIIYNAFRGKSISGWPSLMVVMLFLGGLIIMMLGVIGEYLWRCLDETRKRPIYFLEESQEYRAPHSLEGVCKVNLKESKNRQTIHSENASYGKAADSL